jgi:hypothetical protein
MTTNETKRYAILFEAVSDRVIREGGYYTLRVVTINEDNQVRNGVGEWMDDLTFECFLYRSQYPPRCNEPEWLAGELEYRSPHKVDRPRAEIMLKTLRKAEVGLSKLIKPTDFAQYVVLVSLILGIKYVAIDNYPDRKTSWYQDTTYTIRPIKDAQALIAEQLQRPFAKPATTDQAEVA